MCTKHYWNEDNWQQLGTERKTCPRATLPTINCTWTGLGMQCQMVTSA